MYNSTLLLVCVVLCTRHPEPALLFMLLVFWFSSKSFPIETFSLKYKSLKGLFNTPQTGLSFSVFHLLFFLAFSESLSLCRLLILKSASEAMPLMSTNYAFATIVSDKRGTIASARSNYGCCNPHESCQCQLIAVLRLLMCEMWT